MILIRALFSPLIVTVEQIDLQSFNKITMHFTKDLRSARKYNYVK